MEENNFSITVTDYIGVMENGVGVILSMIFSGYTFELIYWFNKENEYKLTASQNLLEILNVENIYQYNNLDKLLKYINLFVLPPRKEIFEQFKL